MRSHKILGNGTQFRMIERQRVFQRWTSEREPKKIAGLSIH